MKGIRKFSTLAFDATWEALQAPGWNDTQLASLQTAWEGCDFESDMAAAFEMERAMQVDFFNQLKNSKKKLAFAVAQREQTSEFMGGALPTHGFVLNWLHIPLWRVIWVDQDELRSLNWWQFYIERERSARSNSWNAVAVDSTNGPASEFFPWLNLGDGKDQRGWYDRVRFLFSNEQVFMDNIIRKTLGAQVQQQMAITAIALARYKLRTDTLPSDLNALVPDFLKTIPRDRMDGKALRYRVLPGDGYDLYSVGEDGRDDGGDPAMRNDKKHYRQIWDGRDALWPSAASAEESAAAMVPTTD